MWWYPPFHYILQQPLDSSLSHWIEYLRSAWIFYKISHTFKISRYSWVPSCHHFSNSKRWVRLLVQFFPFLPIELTLCIDEVFSIWPLFDTGLGIQKQLEAHIFDPILWITKDACIRYAKAISHVVSQSQYVACLFGLPSISSTWLKSNFPLRDHNSQPFHGQDNRSKIYFGM